VPFLAVMFSVLKAFGVHQQIEPFLAQALEPLGERGQELTERIIGFVSNLKVGVLGAVGVAGLFFTTFSMIDQIEQSLNSIWRVRQPRPLARKFSDYLSVVLVGPVLVFTAFAMIASAQSHWLVQRLMEIQPLGYLVVSFAQVLPFVMLCGAFTFLYKFLPNTQVRLGSALVGGVTTGVLWQLAGTAFAAFVAGSGKYSAIYSSFAILILFLIWLYLTWIIVLVGAQVSFFHQHPSTYLSHVPWRRHTYAFRERLALAVLLDITRRYLSGRPPYRPAELAAALDVPLPWVEPLIDEFVGQRIVYRTEEPEGLTLGRPPEQVALTEILNVIRGRRKALDATDYAFPDAIRHLLQQRDEAVEQALEGITLRSLADQSVGAPRTTSIPSATPR
ncbi:MAG: YhjD/YihY/BrkB family envelope integrity protein, partial [Nitrospirales bacterium]